MAFVRFVIITLVYRFVRKRHIRWRFQASISRVFSDCWRIEWHFDEWKLRGIFVFVIVPFNHTACLFLLDELVCRVLCVGLLYIYCHFYPSTYNVESLKSDWFTMESAYVPMEKMRKKEKDLFNCVHCSIITKMMLSQHANWEIWENMDSNEIGDYSIRRFAMEITRRMKGFWKNRLIHEPHSFEIY